MSGMIVLVLRLLLAATLYAFFLAALFFLWRQFKSGENNHLPAGGRIAIRNLLDEQQQPITFLKTVITIGRDAGNDLILDDDTVSSRHARLFYQQKQWWLEDQQSTNGTFLNGQAISTPTVVISGDRVGCGRIDLEVIIQTAARLDD